MKLDKINQTVGNSQVGYAPLSKVIKYFKGDKK